ncbi:MAG TPA: GWxTD domain-containing protein [Candidatus Saccharimonadales bacterium]|nr:GWxTD domain-containing protein [Candidatus Saccharimonadales bacterium]
MSMTIKKFSAFLTALALVSLPASAQQSQSQTPPPSTAPNPAEIPQNQKLTKEQKQKMKKTLKELDTPYKTWLNEDVVYIISPEERQAFLQLETNEEREQFIEAFWLRRSSNPDLPDNDFKEEHYRRIAYANEHFASGIPGWKTDRGRIYIIWGKPDEIESHPTGGTYDRPMDEGGGSTTTYAWERWRYRYLEGIQENVELEFVDPSGSGEYHLTMDPGEKDALLHVPGAGLSLMESMGMASKADRFTRSDGMTLPTTLGGTPSSLNEFNRLELYAKVNRPPEVKYKDLEAIVTSRMVRDQLKFSYQTDFLKVTSDTALVPITVQVPNNQLSFKAKDGVHSAELNIFGRVSSLTGKVIQTFEDSVTKDFPDSLFQLAVKQMSIYQKSLPLRPGLYRLDLVVKDVSSGNVGAVNTRLAVPRYNDDTLEASSLILADQIQHVPAKQVGTGQFVLGSSKVRPRLDGDFTPADKLGIYMQVYNLKPDEKTHKTDATFVYTVKKGDQQVMQFKETTADMKQTGDQVTLERLLPLATLTPGKYTLDVSATDKVAQATISRTADFTIKAPVDQKAAANVTPGR